MINYFKLDSTSLLDENNFKYLMSDLLQETEEAGESIPFARRIPTRLRSWVEAVLSDQDTSMPIIVDVSRSPKTVMVTPQIGEKWFQWICVTTEKTTPYSNVSYLLPYTLLTEKSEFFSPDFHEIRKRVKSLFQPELARVSAISQAIEEPVIEKINEIITAECLEFCKSHNIIKTLNECLYQVKQNFLFLQKVQAELSYFHDDEEFDSKPHVEIEVKIDTSREIAESNYDNWLDWFVKKVPDTIRKFFILTIDRV